MDLSVGQKVTFEYEGRPIKCVIDRLFYSTGLKEQAKGNLGRARAWVTAYDDGEVWPMVVDQDELRPAEMDTPKSE